MGTSLCKLMATMLMAMSMAQLASAHPGHAPTDVAAEISQPLAGPDHFVAFVALSSVLLVALRFALKRRDAAKMRE
jgi:hydrogenase/urease accessory protein HupE